MIFSIDLYSMEHNTFGWLSERGDNFFNLLQKEGGTQKGGGGGGPLEKGGFQTWRKLWSVQYWQQSLSNTSKLAKMVHQVSFGEELSSLRLKKFMIAGSSNL